MLITVLSGVLVFILSQYFLELIIKPNAKLKELYGILSKTLLQYHSKYINGTLIPDEIEIIRKASTNLLSQAWICFRSISKREQFLKVSKEINYILSQSQTENKNYEGIISSVKKIENLDSNIIITYEIHE